MGPLPPIPSSTVLIEDAPTGRVKATALSQVLAHALFNDDSDQALRPEDPTTLLAYAKAAQHGMQAGVPKTTDSKNRAKWRLWEQFMREIGGAIDAVPSVFLSYLAANCKVEVLARSMSSFFRCGLPVSKTFSDPSSTST
jgi:hypothetical protein